MSGSYDPGLVVLSIIVAIIASYVALDLASRVSASRHSKAAKYWLLGGAVSMGVGIWSMHFIGMQMRADFGSVTSPIPARSRTFTGSAGYLRGLGPGKSSFFGFFCQRKITVCRPAPKLTLRVWVFPS